MQWEMGNMKSSIIESATLLAMLALWENGPNDFLEATDG